MRPYAVEFKSPLELSAQGEYTHSHPHTLSHTHTIMHTWNYGLVKNKTTTKKRDTMWCLVMWPV